MESSSLPNNLFRTLVDHMNEGVWVGDSRERTLYANPKFCEMVGYKMKDMLGLESYVFWDKESAARVRGVNQNDRKSGKSSSYEGNLQTKDKKLIPVLLSGAPLPDGGTIGIMTDLRDLKKKQETAKLLEHALASSSEGILLIDNEGIIQSWNGGARLIFGYAKRDILKKPLTTLFPEWKNEEMLHEKSTEFSLQLGAHHQSGSALTIGLSMSPLPKNKQNLTYLLLARDVTSQRRFEEELSLKYQKLSEAYNQFGIVRRQMDYIFDLAALCSSRHDKRTLADYIVSSLVMLSHVDGCVLEIYNKEKKTLDVVSSFGMGEGWAPKKGVAFAGSLEAHAFLGSQPLKILDVLREPLFRWKEDARKQGYTSALVIPLGFQGSCVGSVSLYVTAGKKLELFENRFIEKYAQLLGIVLTSSEHTGGTKS